MAGSHQVKAQAVMREALVTSAIESAQRAVQLGLPADAIARDFAQDVSPAEANLIHATQGAVRGANFEQPVTVAAWTGKPSWYIVAANDRMMVCCSGARSARLVLDL